MDFLQDGETEAAEEEDDDMDFYEIFEESPDIEINYDLIRSYEEKEAEALNKPPNASQLNAIKIKEAVMKYRKHDNDCGSAEAQITAANERIKYLTQHLLVNKKDFAAKRGLDALVVKRRRFLNYLYETDKPKAELLIKEMGIRFRPPGRLWDKEAKYGAFKNTKTPAAKLAQKKV